MLLNKFKITLFLFLLSSVLILKAQTIPEDRLVEWSTAGLLDEQISYSVQLDFVSLGADSSGSLPNDEIFNDLLLEYEEESIQLNIPNGTYRFESPITLPPNFMLQGEEVDSCLFLFDLEVERDLINIKGLALTDEFKVMASIEKGEVSISLDQAKGIDEGDWFKMVENDSTIIFSDWAIASSGQIFQVKEIEGNTIITTAPLRRAYDIKNDPKLIKLKPIKNVFIDQLSIERTNPTQSQTSNIAFDYAVNCLVKCVKSKFCNFAHLEISNSSNLEVVGSYFNDAFDFGGGGKAYGVALQYTSGACLVRDNNFQKLRHSILLQAGANGNVIAYNHSLEPFWTGTNLPSNSAGDLVLHGNYSYANLFEGNHAQQIVIDNSHGLNGPLNTFFRNRLDLYGIFMSHPSEGQNFVANEVSNEGFLLGNYSLQGKNHFEFGNNIKGEYLPKGTGIAEEGSLYLDDVPTFYLSDSSWPVIGPPNDLGQYPILAALRYNSGLWTVCNEGKLINKNEEVLKNSRHVVSPNPANELLNIEGELVHWEIISPQGQILKRGTAASLNLGDIDDGLIYLVIYEKSGNFSIKKIIVSRS